MSGETAQLFNKHAKDNKIEKTNNLNRIDIPPRYTEKLNQDITIIYFGEANVNED